MITFLSLKMHKKDAEICKLKALLAAANKKLNNI